MKWRLLPRMIRILFRKKQAAVPVDPYPQPSFELHNDVGTIIDRARRAMGLSPHKFTEFRLYAQAKIGQRTLYIDLGPPAFVMINQHSNGVVFYFAPKEYVAREVMTILGVIDVDDENIPMGRLSPLSGGNQLLLSGDTLRLCHMHQVTC